MSTLSLQQRFTLQPPAWLARSELGRSIWAFRREFLWVGIFSLFSNVLLLTPTLYMLQVFDRVMISHSDLTLIALTLITTLLFGVMAFSDWIRSRLLVRAGVRFDEFLNARVFRAGFDASLGQTGHNPIQSFSDLTNVRQFMTGNGIFVLFDVPWSPIYIGVLFMMHPVLGWSSLVFTVLLLLLAWYSNQLTRRSNEQANQSQVASTTYLAGKMRHAETVEAMGMLESLRRHWLAIHNAQLGHAGEATHLQHQVQAFVKFVQYSQQSIILAIGALLAIWGEISIGAMVASNALMSNALRPISLIVSSWKQFADARLAYGRLEALLDEHPIRDAAHQQDRIQGQISIRNLQATAKGREQAILKNLTLDFRAGEVVAIVGPSGAGKSTLARCLVGVWPEKGGSVLLDGQDIDRWSRDELGPHLGYLPQDIELMEGTIAENIGRFGDINPEWVIDAAQRTGIHEMVLRFPNGYDTPMGVAGGLLSGGQRQRIGLARAIYGSPSVVVLDEPNANLDDAGEAALVKTIQDLKSRGKTVFMVVHQRAVLTAADRILVLDNGVIQSFGPIQDRPAIHG